MRKISSFSSLSSNYCISSPYRMNPQVAFYKKKHLNLFIYFACFFYFLFVCLYPINDKTAEPIGPKFFVGHHVTTAKRPIRLVT